MLQLNDLVSENFPEEVAQLANGSDVRVKEIKNERFQTVTELGFSCLPLRSQYSRSKCSLGKERLPFSGDWQPGKKVDSCPRTNSKDCLALKDFKGEKGKQSQLIMLCHLPLFRLVDSL